MSRALAHVELVSNIEPIEGADRIELLTVLGWNVIQQKNTVEIGDKVVYIEIDSKVPAIETFEFLEKRGYKIKSMKMRGVISQGLVMTFDQLGLDASKYNVGDDLTDKLGITKIETDEEKRLKKSEGMESAIISMKARHKKFFSRPLVKKLMKYAFFRRIAFFFLGKKRDKPRSFPGFIRKTDEIRVENIPSVLGQKKHYVRTEKIDGTSTTFAIKRKGRKYEFIVCSRNVRQQDVNQKCYHDCGNVYWEMFYKYNIADFLISRLKETGAEIVILQGETYGEGLQGNPYKLDHREFRGFNLINTDERNSYYDRYTSRGAEEICNTYGIMWVPIIDDIYETPSSMKEMKKTAEGKSVINPEVLREGIVYRCPEDDFSFKNVSNSYLLKHND